MKGKVLCLSHHCELSDTLGAIDGFEVSYSSPDDLQARLRDVQPDIVVLDIRDDPPALSRLEALKRDWPASRILLIVEENEDDGVLLQFLVAGAIGYMTYPQALMSLGNALVAVMENQAWLPRKMVSRLIDTITALDKR